MYNMHRKGMSMLYNNKKKSVYQFSCEVCLDIDNID